MVGLRFFGTIISSAVSSATSSSARLVVHCCSGVVAVVVGIGDGRSTCTVKKVSDAGPGSNRDQGRDGLGTIRAEVGSK